MPKTEAAHAGVQNEKRLSEVKRLLDNWAGESKSLVAAGVMIDSLIKSAPDFLPVYIEKARLTIMRGATGTNDFKQANRDALAILAELQKKDPNYAKSYVLAGHAFLNVGDFDHARASLERAERIGTTDPWLYNNFADLYGRMRQYDKALAYAKKALPQAKDDSKALVTAIAFISEFSRRAGHPAQAGEIPRLLFASFRDPEQRMRIAVRLTDAYQGAPKVLDYAYEIIQEQLWVTPGLESANLAMAEWLLAKGFTVSRDHVRRYDAQFSSAAEEILDAIKPSPSANERIFAARFGIALGSDDLKKASALLKAATEAGDVPRGALVASEALMMWLREDYAAVIQTEESLVESDPDYADQSLLAAAYTRLGRTDIEAAYHKRRLQRNPSAWNLGNYAHFLLMTMHDIDGAIVYGERALEEMKYPIASNDTALAHLTKASMLNRDGNAAAAKIQFQRAQAIGIDEDYVFEYCQTYCADIQKLLMQP
jgi:tetratricopeptide (TPR) repeat protein